MERNELVKIVEKLQQTDYSSEQKGDELMETLEENIIHPTLSDLIFRNDKDLTAEAIVEAASSYKPIMLPEQFD